MSGALETLLLGLCSCLLPSNQRGCGAAASAPVESILRAGWWLSWKESWECGDVVQCISSTCPKILHLQIERVFVLKGQFTWKTEPVVLFIHLNCSVVSLELSALSACGARRVTVMHLKKTQQQCLLPKILNRSLKITCRPCCEPEQMKEQFIQKNQECLFPSLPQFLEIVLMWVLQISALKMSASSQMWYHQICSVFFLLVLRGFVSLCFSLLPTHFQSRPWRRWRTSPRGGLWSGRRRRRAPATWARWLTLRHLETRCPGTCPNTIAWSAPSQPPETCWTRQRGPSSALQVRCFTRKENRSRSVCEGDVRVCPLFMFMFCSSAHFKNSAVPLLLTLVVHGALRKEVLVWSIHHSTRGGLW